MSESRKSGNRDKNKIPAHKSRAKTKKEQTPSAERIESATTFSAHAAETLVRPVTEPTLSAQAPDVPLTEQTSDSGPEVDAAFAERAPGDAANAESASPADEAPPETPTDEESAPSPSPAGVASGESVDPFATAARAVAEAESAPEEPTAAAPQGEVATTASAHVGAVGDWVTLPLLYTGSTPKTTPTGLRQLHEFRTEGGDSVLWETTAALAAGGAARLLVAGQVKAHEEENGEKRTVLSRCRVAPVQAAAPHAVAAP